jgi:hypothetical protein
MNKIIKESPDYLVQVIGLIILYAGFGMFILWGWDFLMFKTSDTYESTLSFSIFHYKDQMLTYTDYAIVQI